MSISLQKLISKLKEDIAAVNQVCDDLNSDLVRLMIDRITVDLPSFLQVHRIPEGNIKSNTQLKAFPFQRQNLLGVGNVRAMVTLPSQRIVPNSGILLGKLHIEIKKYNLLINEEGNNDERSD